MTSALPSCRKSSAPCGNCTNSALRRVICSAWKRMHSRPSQCMQESARGLVPFANEPYITVNGRKCRNVFFCEAELERRLRNYRCSAFSLIHGDCAPFPICFCARTATRFSLTRAAISASPNYLATPPTTGQSFTIPSSATTTCSTSSAFVWKLRTPFPCKSKAKSGSIPSRRFSA